MYDYFDPILSISQCGFWQGCSTQTCVLAMTEHWRKSIDNGRVRGVVMTNLSKAFECIRLQHMTLRAQD